MKKLRFVIVFLLTSLLCCGSVFALEDMFNTTGEIPSDTVFTGIRFDIPDYYKVKSESSNDLTLTYNDGSVMLGFVWNTTQAYGITNDHKGLRALCESVAKNMSEVGPIEQEGYSDTTVAGLDAVSYFAKFRNQDEAYNVYLLVINSVSQNEILLIEFIVDATKDASQYEDDFATMIQGATYEGETSAPPATNTQPTSIGSDVETYTSEDLKEDLHTVGEAINDYGAMIDNINNGDLGAAMGNLGDIYGKIGDMYD